MPLLLPALKAEILKIIDSTHPEFVGWPIVFDESGVVDLSASNVKAASNWANAARVYFSQGIVPGEVPIPIGMPIIKPGTHDLAVTAMTGAMASQLDLNSPTSPTGFIALNLGWMAYASELALGVVPGTGVITAPAVLVIAPLPIVPPPTPEAAATKMAGEIDLWARTGTATPLIGPPVLWS